MAAKKFSVAVKTGEVSIPKGTKKGKYQVKIRVSARGDASYISGVKTVSCTIWVK